MKVLGEYRKVQFGSLRELKNFMREGCGDVLYEDFWGTDITEVRWDYEEKNLCIGMDNSPIRRDDLVNIYAYERVLGRSA